MPAVRYVDVFTARPYLGNPVAVVDLRDAEEVPDDARLAEFARWTNLSETTFLLPPTGPQADYRLRIFTPGGELPFAGHPTLGSAHAWLEAGGAPRGDDVVQECGAGLVRVRRGERLAFAAPPLLRSGPVADDTVAQAARACGLSPADVLDAAWVDNGPGWMALLLRDAATVLDVRVDPKVLGDIRLGLAGRHAEGHETAVEVRAFHGALGSSVEDPVTGSLNAGLAQWLVPAGVLPSAYVAAQGTVLQRAGRVHVDHDDTGVWVGGDTVTCVRGTVDL